MKMRTKQVFFVFLFMLICAVIMCGCNQNETGEPKGSSSFEEPNVSSPSEETEQMLALEAAYSINADLDPEARRMTYTEVVQIKNTGSGSTKELYFHIYGNKFKGLRQVEDGDIVVLSVQHWNENLTWQREQDGVLYCVELSNALEPEQTVELTFDCEVIIPDLESMYGISRDGDVQLPMFSVQLAMYDENGWDTAPLPENGDGRYGAAATYELTISVPEDYTLTCNGDEISHNSSNGITTYLYRAENRRDIVIFACKDYVLLERTVGHTSILGYFNETVNGVTQQDMEFVMDCAASSLEYFNSIFVEYPYNTLVITNSALGTNFSPNMEYSGLVTILFGSQQISMKSSTFHEVAHQWFYGLVGNDENREAWLDEGFASFAEGLCLDVVGDTDDTFWKLALISNKAVAEEKINVPNDEASVYNWVMYERSAIFLKTLMDTIGQEKFLSILSDYCKKNMYGIATTEGFLEMIYDGAGVDVSDIVAEFIK